MLTGYKLSKIVQNSEESQVFLKKKSVSLKKVFVLDSFVLGLSSGREVLYPT